MATDRRRPFPASVEAVVTSVVVVVLTAVFVPGLTGASEVRYAADAAAGLSAVPLVYQVRASMPAVVQGAAIASVGRSIYAIGGIPAGAGATNAVQVYDVATDSWASGDAAPTARGGATCTAVGADIYVIGGYNPGPPWQELSTVEVYSTVSHHWRSASDLPIVNTFGPESCVTVGGRIYSIGGYSQWTQHAEVFIFDTKHPERGWRRGRDKPTASSGFGTVAIDSKIWCIGGHTGQSIANVEVYDTRTDRWCHRSDLDLQTPLTNVAAAQFYGNVYIFGGGYNYVTDQVLKLPWWRASWQTAAPLPEGRNCLAEQHVGDWVYLLGGYDVNGLRGDMWRVRPAHPTGFGGGNVRVTSAVAAPARTGAEIVFSLTAPADVTVSVLNMAGRVVRVHRVEDAVQAGTNGWWWNGMTEMGVRAPSGQYLVRIEARAADGSRSAAVTGLRLTH